MMLRRAVNRQEAAPVDFRMPFAPFTSWITLAFLLSVLVLMGLDYPDGTYTIAAIPVVAILLGIGWLILKGNSPFSPTVPSHVLTQVLEINERNDPR
jgi:L-asparagine permease